MLKHRSRVTPQQRVIEAQEALDRIARARVIVARPIMDRSMCDAAALELWAMSDRFLRQGNDALAKEAFMCAVSMTVRGE